MSAQQRVSCVFALSVLWLAALACAGSSVSAPNRPTEPTSGQPQPTHAAVGEATRPAPAPTEDPNAPDAPEAHAPAINEQRLLVLEWPRSIRAGDSDVVRLDLVLDEQGNLTPTAQTGDGQLQTQPVQIPNLYDTHNVIAEARLDMAGMAVAPEGVTSIPLRPREKASFIWSVRPSDSGEYRGAIWVYIVLVPLNGGKEIRQVLSTQVINLNVTNFLGLNGTAARILGVVGTLLGSLLGLDKIFEFGLTFIRRLRGGSSG
jgi:hypothetical protein